MKKLTVGMLGALATVFVAGGAGAAELRVGLALVSKKVLSLFTSAHFKSANTVYNILGREVINKVIAQVFGQNEKSAEGEKVESAEEEKKPE